MSKVKSVFQIIRMDKAERTQQGFLRIPAYLTRTGVFNYRNADGTTSKQLRHPDDVFKPESILTLQGVPFTNEHPKGLVDPKSLKKDLVGWVGDTIEIDTIYLKGFVTVADATAIDDVESGKKEVSCGYLADVVDEKGFYNGEEYNCRQTNIVYNHVSLVKKGRAGSNVKLQLDSDQIQLIDETNKTSEEEEMAKIKLGDVEYDVTAEVADAFGKEQKKQSEAMDSMNKKMADMMPKEAMDKMAAKCDSLTEEVKELKLKKDTSEIGKEEIAKAVKARVKLVSEASKVLKPETKMDEMSDLEIVKAVVTEKFPKLDMKDKSEVYIQARFDQIMETVESDKTAQDELNKTATTVNKDGGDNTTKVSSAESRKKSIADSLSAWKTDSEYKA